jgi:hypothetical protein
MRRNGMRNTKRIRCLGLVFSGLLMVFALAHCDDSPTAPVVSTDGDDPAESEPESDTQLPIPVPAPPRPEACFVYRQILTGLPCTVAFDASCSSHEISEYRWFFEGGPRPDLPLPDTNITTNEPETTYSWARDEECFSFRRFDRIVRLTVVGEDGATDTHEETVLFMVPLLKP